jgi:hypothetical protein
MSFERRLCIPRSPTVASDEGATSSGASIDSESVRGLHLDKRRRELSSLSSGSGRGHLSDVLLRDAGHSGRHLMLDGVSHGRCDASAGPPTRRSGITRWCRDYVVGRGVSTTPRDVAVIRGSNSCTTASTRRSPMSSRSAVRNPASVSPMAGIASRAAFARRANHVGGTPVDGSSGVMLPHSNQTFHSPKVRARWEEGDSMKSALSVREPEEGPG